MTLDGGVELPMPPPDMLQQVELKPASFAKAASNADTLKYAGGLPGGLGGG